MDFAILADWAPGLNDRTYPPRGATGPFKEEMEGKWFKRRYELGYFTSHSCLFPAGTESMVLDWNYQFWKPCLQLYQVIVNSANVLLYLANELAGRYDCCGISYGGALGPEVSITVPAVVSVVGLRSCGLCIPWWTFNSREIRL